MGALLGVLPLIVSAVPQVIGLIGGLVNLIHRQETSSPVPGSGPVKKAAVMNAFEEIALPFVAPILSLLLKRPIDNAKLMPAVSALIDAIVALNNAIGTFPSAQPQS